jgi:LmbE family N-acetylglucosaminyl deacetylase
MQLTAMAGRIVSSRSMTQALRRVHVALIALLCALAPGRALAQLEPLAFDRGASGLGLALRKVGVTGHVLYVTAHPDDENNGVLVRLARGLGLRTALLTVTRGEGGQNAIGPELFEALGVLRTEELMALHRYDGAEQYFGRAYEFGYSFSVEETLARWGREDTLGDVVRVVRAFRPDVILTLPLEGAGGGQHHQAVARLAREAFRAAADPARFPGQIAAGLRPWQALKIYQGGTGGYPEALSGTPVHVPTGVYDPLLGMTWQELGSLARTMHRCQGERQLKADPGPADGVYALVDRAAQAGTGAESDILDGVDTTVTGLARLAPGDTTVALALAPLEAAMAAARASLDPNAPERSVPALVEALRLLRERRAGLDAQGDAASRGDVLDRLGDEERDLERALALAQGLVLEARADDGLVTPGESFTVVVSLWNEAPSPLDVEGLDLDVPAGWKAERLEGEAGPLGGGGARRARFFVTVAPHAPPSQPYWRRSGTRDRFDVDSLAHETLPWSPPDVVARVRCRIRGVETTLVAPAVWRYPGPFVGGEKQHVVTVVPDLSVRVAPEVTVVPLLAAREPVEVRVFVQNDARGPGEAAVRLEAPLGWVVEPAVVPLRFAYEGEEVATHFRVRPPGALRPGAVVLRAAAVHDGRESREGVQAVAYDHIQRRQVVRPAETRVLVLDVSLGPGVSVGYVMGPGDGVADAIRQLGVPVTLLNADDLAFGDLSRFTTIVTGIRAYETRADLRSYHPRLLRWVEAGGHLVVQYNRDAFNRVSPTAALHPGESSPFVPYPAAVTTQRISDETAPVRVLAPGDPLLTVPNRIGQADWEGWVQERGIQFLEARDPRYVDLLAATDPFPYNPGEKRGMLVEASVGKGTWTYVGLGLFRQVPAGVPGGWRLLANLVGRPRGR